MASVARTVLITGANSGLGLEMVKQMVEGPSPLPRLFACCREPDGPRGKVGLFVVIMFSQDTTVSFQPMIHNL